MFRIGDFARLSRVSVKMLRHYDEIGLLKPARVDSETEYRYYTADQLPRLNRIIALKDLGFSLEQIARLLDADLPADQIRGMLKLRQGEIERRLAEEQTRLAQVEARLRQIEMEERFPSYEVIVRSIEPQQVASIRQQITDLNQIEPLFDEVELYVGRYKARAPRPPLLLTHSADYMTQHVDLEVVVPLTTRIPATDRVIVGDLPGAETMACIVHTGSYGSISAAHQVIASWIMTNDYRVCGPWREVYLRYGANIPLDVPDGFLTRKSSELVTELQFPVEKR